MKVPLVFLLVPTCVYAQAVEQRFQYPYDPDVEYSVVSTVERDSAIQATVKRAGAYFTTYTKLQLDCVGKNVRQMGSYNSIQSLESAELDQIEGRIVGGSIADEVGKIVCLETTTATASEVKDLPVTEQADDQS